MGAVRGRVIVAATTGLCALAATPAGAAAVKHPMEPVAVKLANMIRFAARHDRDKHGTLVRRSAYGAIRRLTVFYTARGGEYAPHGAYKLVVATTGLRLTLVKIDSYRLQTPYRLGTKLGTPASGFALRIEERPGGSWETRYEGNNTFNQCTPGGLCMGGSFLDEWGESAPGEALAVGERAIRAARQHAAV
jgi:hypothetical protein